MNRITAQLHSAYPRADMGPGAVVMPLQQALVGGMRKSLLLSLGIGFVLGICLLTLALRPCRKLLLPLAAVGVVAVPLTAGLMHAPQTQAESAPKTGIEDTWQGTTHMAVSMDRRVVWKIARTESGGLKVMMYNPDQGGPGIPASSAGFEGGVLKCAIERLGVRFEGKMSADRRSIAGTWTEGIFSGSLVLERATPDTEWAIPEPLAPTPPMTADADPSFEVATIKPSNRDLGLSSWGMQGGRLTTVNAPMMRLIEQAYDLQPQQVMNAPPWLTSERYDITAKPDTPGLPSEDQARTMLQKLLADRLRLKVHREQRELSAYAMTVAKGGLKIKNSAGDTAGPRGQMSMGGGHAIVNYRNVALGELAGILQQQLDRPVIDQTGLEGKWDIELKWTPGDSLSGEGGDEPPLLTAIQQQLGLKLVARKALVPVLVIDHVEKPSEN